MQLVNIQFEEAGKKQIFLSSGWLNVPHLYVKHLVLQDSRITKILDSGFTGKIFSKLKILGIYNVPIIKLYKSTFLGLKMLRRLSLKDLRLYKVYDNVLENMPKLEKFSLDNCRLTPLNLTNFFGGQPLMSLNRVSIQNCNFLDGITETTFSALQNITQLKLNSNQIKTIEPKSFDRISLTLETLILSSNFLTKIPADFLIKNHNVWIDLTENLWHCDCNMENVRILAQTMDRDQLHGLTCNTPEEYRGMELIKCPRLCEENNGNENEIEKFDEKIDIECEISNLYKTINLTKSSHKIGLVSRKKDDELYIDTELLSNHFKIIEFNQNFVHGKSTCTSFIKGNRMENVKFKQKLIANIFYRFCWMREEFYTIFPLDCITFHFNSHKTGGIHLGEDLNAWIMESDKSILITVCVLLAIFAPVIGILIAVIMAKLFPKWIRGQKRAEKGEILKDRDSRKYVFILNYSFTFYDLDFF